MLLNSQVNNCNNMCTVSKVTGSEALKVSRVRSNEVLKKFIGAHQVTAVNGSDLATTSQLKSQYSSIIHDS